MFGYVEIYDEILSMFQVSKELGSAYWQGAKLGEGKNTCLVLAKSGSFLGRLGMKTEGGGNGYTPFFCVRYRATFQEDLEKDTGQQQY